MTTVVAAACDGLVVMGADSCTNVYDRPIVDGARKILRLKVGDQEALLGFSGAGALPGLLIEDLKIDGYPADGEDPQRWANAIARAITDIAVQAGLIEAGQMDSHMILGWGGRLWTITHMQAISHPDGVAAIGSGEGPAIGAVDALLLVGTYPLDQVIRRAVHIAINRDRYSDGDVQIEQLGGPSDG